MIEFHSVNLWLVGAGIVFLYLMVGLHQMYDFDDHCRVRHPEAAGRVPPAARLLVLFMWPLVLRKQGLAGIYLFYLKTKYAAKGKR